MVVKEELVEPRPEVGSREDNLEVPASSKAASHSASAAESSKQAAEKNAEERARKEERETSTRPGSPMSGVVSSESSKKERSKTCERCRTQK